MEYAGTATFNVLHNGTETYKWQFSLENGNTFVHLPQNPQSTVKQTMVLLIDNVEISKNKYYYKVIVFNC